MAFSSTIIQPAPKPALEKPVGNDAAASLLSVLLLSVLAANKSKKALRKMKLHLLWMAFKTKFTNLFHKDGKSISTRTLLIIIIAVLALILLLTVSPLVAIVLLLAGLLIVLLVKF